MVGLYEIEELLFDDLGEENLETCTLLSNGIMVDSLPLLGSSSSSQNYPICLVVSYSGLLVTVFLHHND